MKNVLVALFEVESEGYQAISNLSKMPDTGSYTIYQMALVKKEDGKVNVCESYDSGINTTDNTVNGGLIGALAGIFGGALHHGVPTAAGGALALPFWGLIPAFGAVKQGFCLHSKTSFR